MSVTHKTAIKEAEMAKRYLIYQEFYFADMVRDGWMEYISPEVAALCPTGIGGWFSFLREDENGKTIDEILDDWKNNYDFVKYILKIKRFPINDREEVIRISYVDEHDELCECIYVLEKETV